MTDSLAQSLVDAAARAMGVVAPEYGGPSPEEMDDEQRAAIADLARHGLAAALDLLAERWNAERRDITMPADTRTLAAITVSVNKLRKLAAEIRESPCP